MKRLIIIIITVALFLLSSCKDPESTETTTDTTSDTGTPPPPVTPPPPAVPKPPVTPPPVVTPPPTIIDPIIVVEPTVIKLSLLTENGTLYFYDGTDFIFQDNTKPVNCGSKCFTDNNTSNTYDNQGEIISSQDLIITPAFIIDNIIIENIPPSVAADMGGQAKNYVRIFIDDTEFPGAYSWTARKYTAVDFIKTYSGAYIIIDSLGGYHSIDGTTGINHAKDLLIYDFTSTTARITDSTGDYPVTWSQGYFGNAKHWQLSGGPAGSISGKWISNNGYEFFEGVLSENVNAMWVWNSGPYPVALPGIERPVVISAGVIGTASYWIEANTGWLFSYTNDQIQMISRIYQGDGYRTTGMTNSKELSPVIINQDLYFNYSASVWKLDIPTGIIEIFYAGRATIREW